MISTCACSIRRRAGCCANICAHGAVIIASPTRIAPRGRPLKTLALLDVARRAGPAIGAVCEYIHRTEGVLAPRRILGVLELARKHGPALTEDAAHFALEVGAPSYRFLRRYLGRVKLPATALKQIDPLIRQLTAYRALIEQRAAAS